MAELLFELGCEEIPADDLFVLPEELKNRTAEAFQQNRLSYSRIETYATPRRLVLCADLDPVQKDLREQKIGPSREAAVDRAGNPTLAGLGFARNVGLSFKKLKTVQTPKGEYLCAEIVIRGKPTQDVLKEILPRIVASLPFKRYMKWGAQDYKFGRPLRSLLFLYNGKIIRMRIAGISSGGFTFGHRFLGSGKRIRVLSFQDYCRKLEENGVILSFADRVAKIAQELREHAAVSGGALKEDPELLYTMANEVEYPQVLTGTFASDFLKLPQEILINAMRKYQKYFCALSTDGRILPVFFAVLNTRAAQPELIRQGHERVLQARLRDAEFFWQEDLKTTLAERRPRLAHVTYHEKLGSYSEKVHRMLQIAEHLFIQLKQSELEEKLKVLIQDCKADLMTHMVGEFPELQGIMSGLYAQREGYPNSDWQALYDQYLPISAEDAVPRNLPGGLLSLVDRIEILASGYVLNMIPSGSKDPYALRRIATGAVRIVLEHELDLDLQPLFDHALSLYSVKTNRARSELLQGLLDLMEARFRFLMEQKGVAHDCLNAVLNAEKKSLVEAYAKTTALWAIRGSEDVKTLARGFKRINNIIFDQPPCNFDVEALEEDGEQRLHRAFSDLEFRVSQNIQERQYADALDIMVTLGPEIDNFFDEVLVMTEEERLRKNRIALLQRISELYRKIADFSALQIEL